MEINDATQSGVNSRFLVKDDIISISLGELEELTGS